MQSRQYTFEVVVKREEGIFPVFQISPDNTEQLEKFVQTRGALTIAPAVKQVNATEDEPFFFRFIKIAHEGEENLRLNIDSDQCCMHYPRGSILYQVTHMGRDGEKFAAEGGIQALNNFLSKIQFFHEKEHWHGEVNLKFSVCGGEEVGFETCVEEKVLLKVHAVADNPVVTSSVFLTDHYLDMSEKQLSFCCFDVTDVDQGFLPPINKEVIAPK